MFLLMSPVSASSTAATSLRDRFVAAAMLFRTSDLLGALTLPPGFAAVGAFAILCHPPCEVRQRIEVIWYIAPQENQRIGRKLEALPPKLQVRKCEKRWKSRTLHQIYLQFSPFLATSGHMGGRSS